MPKIRVRVVASPGGNWLIYVWASNRWAYLTMRFTEADALDAAKKIEAGAEHGIVYETPE